MLLFVLRLSLAFSLLLDSLVVVGVLLKRRGPHYTQNFLEGVSNGWKAKQGIVYEDVLADGR